jgi:hypothetical protein
MCPLTTLGKLVQSLCLGENSLPMLRIETPFYLYGHGIESFLKNFIPTSFYLLLKLVVKFPKHDIKSLCLSNTSGDAKHKVKISHHGSSIGHKIHFCTQTYAQVSLLSS